jgi:hypothetical protein
MHSACAVNCHLWSLWLHLIFPHYLINGTIFGEKLLNIKWVIWFSLQMLSEILLILRSIQRDTVTKKWKRLRVKYQSFLSHLNKTWIFSTGFRKQTQIQNFIKIRPVGAEVFRAKRQDGRTGMKKLIVTLSNFANAPKNGGKSFLSVTRLTTRLRDVTFQKTVTVTGIYVVTFTRYDL